MQYSDQKYDDPLSFSGEIDKSMTEHFLQYTAVRDFCKGKRILDISACAGYGPYLMAEWGAKEVVSICFSSAHKSESAAHLLKDRVKFISAPPEEFTSKLIGEKFDLIVSLSSTQNTADSAEFLSEIHKLLNSNGAIIFSFKSSDAPALADDSHHLETHEKTGQLIKKIKILEAELARQATETASYRTLLESNIQDFPGINSQFSAFNHPSKWERRFQKWKKSIKKRLK